MKHTNTLVRQEEGEGGTQRIQLEDQPENLDSSLS